MKMFAKLYGPPSDQILIMRGTDDAGDPEVRIFFMPPGDFFGLCSFAFGFPDTEAGSLQANLAFDTMTEAQARAAASESLRAFDQLGGRNAG